MKRMLKQEKIDMLDDVVQDENKTIEFLKGVKLSEGLKPIKEIPVSWNGDENYTFNVLQEVYSEGVNNFMAFGYFYYVPSKSIENAGFIEYQLDEEGKIPYISGLMFEYDSSTPILVYGADDKFYIQRELVNHNIFISGVARNKNINVSFQIHSPDFHTEALSITDLITIIGKNTKIAVSGYHEDLGVIIAGVTVNSNNELTFVGVNSSATSIAWSEISDVSITDSIHLL